MPRSAQLAGELIDLCQSGFERDVFTRLIALGYCITPQVGVGSWRIDLVVEGENDRRLAIELDGDKWHPPEQWLDDMLRQRAMERMGWHFWRCWASSFRRDPAACMADLVSTLTSMSIRPMPRESRNNIYTEHRTEDVTGLQSPDSESSVIHEPIIEIGDQVIVVYDDSPGQQAVLIVSSEQHDPDMGIFKSSSPTGASLLGQMVDEEVIILIGKRSRPATILAINKNDSIRMNDDYRDGRDATGTLTALSYEKVIKAQSPSPDMQTGQHQGAEKPKTPDPSRRPVQPNQKSSNRVIAELQVLDEKLENPRCSICSGEAQLAINNEGPVTVCTNHGCKNIGRIEVQTLQRLADRLGIRCYQCNGRNLESHSGKFSNYLKCRDDGANNSWKAGCERLGKS
jgi:very-short-patch-repair endonuclease